MGFEDFFFNVRTERDHRNYIERQLCHTKMLEVEMEGITISKMKYPYFPTLAAHQHDLGRLLNIHIVLTNPESESLRPKPREVDITKFFRPF